MFSVFGAILTVYGFLSDPAIYDRSLGININLGWGLTLLVFGASMLMLGLLRGRFLRESAECAKPKLPRR
jgi:hypothetical protein